MNSFIRIKPLSQTRQAKYQRELRINDDPKVTKAQAADRQTKRAKIDARKRAQGSRKFSKRLSMARWNEVARHRSLGRDTGSIAVAMTLPEWVVKVLVDHITMTQDGHGTASGNLEAANNIIIGSSRLQGGAK